MIIHDCEQKSEEWYRLKLGKPSPSQFHNIITPRGVPTTGDRRRKYMYRLIAEKLLQQSMDDRFENYWTKRGKDLEEEAAEAFQSYIRTKNTFRKVGLITTNDGKVAASPDRIVRDGGAREGLEIKCPSPWVQVEYLLQGPEDNYKPQVQGYLMVCDLKAWHFWSFHPQMPPVHVMTLRDDEYIERLAKELWYFINEMEAEYDRAKRLGPYRVLAEALKLSADLTEVPGTFPWSH
jgi:hypothetical protein